MLKANWLLLIFIGALLPAAVVADDASLSRSDDHQPPVTTTSLETLRLAPDYSSRWRLSHPIETMAFPKETSVPIADIDFENPGAFARVSKLRELSLLTLAEVGRTRLFLGVSDRGLLGFHLGALPKLGDERCLEFARMPYLKNPARDDIDR